MTQQELAKRAGINFTTVSKLEKGTLTGTLSLHRKIAKALGTTLSELYKGLDEPPKTTLDINRAQKAQAEIFYYNYKAISQILVKQISKHKMAPELIRLEENGMTHTEQKPKNTEYFIFVLEGKIEIKVGDLTYQLKKDESIYFDASQPHIIRNLFHKTSRCLRVTSPAAL